MDQGKDAQSITRLLQNVKLYWQEVWRRKWWIIAGALLVASIKVAIAWNTPKKYNAPLTFMINSDEGSGLSGVGAILGELGFAGGSRGGYNYEKITQLATSRMILERVMLTQCTYKGSKDFLGNHILDVGVPLDEDSTSFRFGHSKDSSYLIEQGKLIIKLAKYLRGNPTQGKEGVITMDYDEESTILKINAKTTDPELSTLIANIEYDVLSEFYIQNTIGKQESTYQHVSRKADSIYTEIQSSEAQLARYIDKTNGIILQTNRLPREQLARKIEMLYLMYGEAMKNRETAEFLLKSSTPYFQVIDRPGGPFQPVGKSKKRAVITGGLLGGIIALVLVIGLFWLRERIKIEQSQST